MLEHGLEESADVLMRAFEDYLVRIPFTVTLLLNAARADSVDFSLSRVFLRDGAAVGAALIARRGWTCRLAGMGIVPKARRSGIGRAAVEHLLHEAKARGDRTMFLEVIEQNTAAVELYRACGFRIVRRLLGFAGPPPVAPFVGSEPDAMIDVDLRDVAAAVTRYGLVDLPWQISGETIATLTPPAVGYRLGHAWIAITDPVQSVVTVRGLAGRDLAETAELVRAVISLYRGKDEWRFNPIWPEELMDAVASVRLPRTALTQWQMKRDIDAITA